MKGLTEVRIDLAALLNISTHYQKEQKRCCIFCRKNRLILVLTIG